MTKPIKIFFQTPKEIIKRTINLDCFLSDLYKKAQKVLSRTKTYNIQMILQNENEK